MFKEPVWLPNSTSDAVLFTVCTRQASCVSSARLHVSQMSRDVKLGNGDWEKLEGQEFPIQETAESMF